MDGIGVVQLKPEPGQDFAFHSQEVLSAAGVLHHEAQLGWLQERREQLGPDARTWRGFPEAQMPSSASLKGQGPRRAAGLNQSERVALVARVSGRAMDMPESSFRTLTSGQVCSSSLHARKRQVALRSCRRGILTWPALM